MNLPDYKGLTTQFRKQLRSFSVILTICQIAVGGLFPILEGLFINLFTGTTDPQLVSHYQRFLWATIVIHFVLLFVVITASTPLPAFLLEFDELTDRTKVLEEQVIVRDQFIGTFRGATNAAEASLLAIEKMEQNPLSDLEKIFAEVLGPWVAERTEIFGFQDGDALYNFAVYWYDKQNDVLQKSYRECDSRILVQNRDWKPGNGHVGMCYSQGRTLFSLGESEVHSNNLFETGQQSDKDTYKSLISTPITVKGTILGVFVVTSSRSKQFVKELHTPIVELIGRLLAQAIRHCRR